MSVTISYGGTVDSHYSTTLSNGIFLCSRPVGTKAASASDINGVFLLYGQDKRLTITDDSAQVVYVGRSKPAAEMGQFVFNTFTITYRIPPTWMGSPYGFGCDHTTSAENCLRNIVACQHGLSGSTYRNPDGSAPPGTAGVAYLCLYQDSKGRSLYGTLYSLAFKDLVDPAGWIEVSASFTEVYS